MRPMVPIILGVAFALLQACATAPAGTAGASSAVGASASATLLDSSGAGRGTATVTQNGGDLRLVVHAIGLTPGVHGIHVHAVGQCTPPDFTSAGPHWNPTGAVHGKDAPGGPHHGDLPNLSAGADGSAHLEATISAAQLSGGATPLLDADGAAIVIHASVDDYRTDPSGNSGGRIACGVLAAR
jgi:Cu-Zn family superoxide dismutase